MSVEDVALSVDTAKGHLEAAGLSHAENNDDLSLASIKERMLSIIEALAGVEVQLENEIIHAHAQQEEVMSGRVILADLSLASDNAHIRRAERAATMAAGSLVRRQDELWAMQQIAQELGAGLLQLLGTKVPEYDRHKAGADKFQNMAADMQHASTQAADNYLEDVSGQ